MNPNDVVVLKMEERGNKVVVQNEQPRVCNDEDEIVCLDASFFMNDK